MLRWVTLLWFCFMSSAAQADPCEAIPESGPLPSHLGFAARFSGPVTHVIDGDSVCVAVGPTPRDWVEVRLADFWAPESSQAGGQAAKAALERMALGKDVTCVAGMRTYDRIAARCTIAGRSLGDNLRAAGVREGGNGAGRIEVQTRGLSESPRLHGGYRFTTCSAARAAGAAPMHRGSSTYNPNLDGDGDGIACEPYRGR